MSGHPPAGAPVKLNFTDPALEAGVRDILDAVEESLRDSVISLDPELTGFASHLVHAGGKRFRPLLVAVAAQFGPGGGIGGASGIGDGALAEVAKAGVVVELTHLATLYHDDVMDEAPVRRGAPSANARWGNSLAILTGDYLFARAADLAADLGPEAVRIQARTFSRLVHGQIAETLGPRRSDPIAHHLDVIAEKTGSLIGTSARFGALFSGAPSPVVAALADYGELIGIAFQLSDDLLDIASDSASSGKTPGTDLREGVPTLPTLYALADTDPGTDAARLRHLLSQGPLADDALVAEALGLLRASTAFARARATVRGYADRARAQAARLPDVPARAALTSLADVVADRLT